MGCPGEESQVPGQFWSGVHSVTNVPPIHSREGHQRTACGDVGSHRFGQEATGLSDPSVFEVVHDRAGRPGVEKGCLGYEVVGKKTVGTAPEIIGAFSADDIVSEPSAREAQCDHDRKCRDRVGHEDGRDLVSGSLSPA
jgi:hypothetical protein